MCVPTGYRLVGRWFTHEQWEAICRRCGQCCTEKVEYDGHTTFLEETCPHRTADDLCDCYDNRFEIEEECQKVTPRAIVTRDLLPPDCAYVELYEDLLDEVMATPEQDFGGDRRRRSAAR